MKINLKKFYYSLWFKFGKEEDDEFFIGDPTQEDIFPLSQMNVGDTIAIDKNQYSKIQKRFPFSSYGKTYVLKSKRRSVMINAHTDAPDDVYVIFSFKEKGATGAQGGAK